MLSLLKKELQSRKFRAYLAGLLAIIGAKYGVLGDVWEWVALACTYILGVAVEDVGKAKAQIEAAKATPALPASEPPKAA